MSIEHEVATFLDRFAAGAAIEYQWILTTGFIGGRSFSMIRAQIGNDMMLCPVSAQHTLETGQVILSDMANVAAKALNLSVSAREVVFCAADDMEMAAPKVRARLLTLCRLATRKD